MDQSLLLTCVARLGEEFRRRGMTDHLRKLRLYWLAARYELLSRRNELDVRWTEAHVVAWLEAFRLPPYEDALPVRRKGSGCPKCGVAQGTVPSGRTELVFPGGARLRCQGCGGEWLEVDG